MFDLQLLRLSGTSLLFAQALVMCVVTLLRAFYYILHFQISVWGYLPSA